MGDLKDDLKDDLKNDLKDELQDDLNDAQAATEQLAALSRYAGNRFDLVQAGGGNTSVKLNHSEMLVKASGISLSQVLVQSGHVRVDYLKIRKFLADYDFSAEDKKQREQTAAGLMSDTRLDKQGKPSIETFLHALLEKYTLHTHPITVNILAATPSWQEDLLAIYPQAICVAYNTPGIDLAIAMAQQMQAFQSQHGSLPKVVFLQNHGLIVSGADAAQVQALTEQITADIETSLGMDFSAHRCITPLQRLLADCGYNQVDMVLSEDQTIASLLDSEDQHAPIWPFCPDTLVYCGIRPAFLTGTDDQTGLQSFIDSSHDYPRIIVLQGRVYCCGSSLKKAREAEELFKFHLIVAAKTGPDTQRLDMDEIAYLSNWDAEKFRQQS